MKIVYIAHPIAGDVENNITKILEIIERINVMEPDVVPFAPYLGDVMALNDNDPEMRKRGLKNDHELIDRGFIDECWVYGDRISEGMRDEIFMFNDWGKEVVLKNKTRFMEEELDRVDSEYNKYLIEIEKEETVNRLLKDNEEDEKCPECLKPTIYEELSTFNGFCEDCSTNNQ